MRAKKSVAPCALILGLACLAYSLDALAENRLLKQLEAEFLELSDMAAPSVVEISVETAISEAWRLR